jgi:hypothetical protein
MGVSLGEEQGVLSWSGTGFRGHLRLVGVFSLGRRGPFGKEGATLSPWIETRSLDPNGESTLPAVTFTQITTGTEHSCGVGTDDSVNRWGANGSGQSDSP